MNRILVTGGAGFIGSHLVDALIQKGNQVTVFDNLDRQVHPRGLPNHFNLRSTFIRGDVRNRQALKEVVCQADAVVHLAAAVGVGQSQYQIAHYVESNIQGTANLLDILVNEKHRVKKLLVASSMSIYGEGLYRCRQCGRVKPELRKGPQEIEGSTDREKVRISRSDWEPKCPRCGGEIKAIPTPEDTPLIANSIYAISKKEQEEMALLIGKTYGLPVVALRFFNVYGPRQSLSNPYTGVTAIFLSRVKNNHPPVVYEDGQQTRDFIWVGDVVQACLLCLENEKADFQVFNVGTGKPVAIGQMAELIIQLLKKKLTPEITYTFRKGDVRHCFADTTQIRKALGFQAKTPLREGLLKLAGWARKVEAKDRFEQAAKELKEKGLT
ncbi:MAG: SDR family NAD(P)-dependent oxidoreductase [Candidatus Omnitrophica bacterium]|nr:SDR family NAD(P)-dependent oxidoreductase [Candidatus Omnitrophota bacterium]